MIGPVIRAIAVDDNDDLWVATSTGVSRLSDHGLSIKEKDENQFVVYPNPASDLVTIILREGASDKVDIYNSSMQLVSSEKITFNKVYIDMSKFSRGMYFIKVNNSIAKLSLN